MSLHGTHCLKFTTNGDAPECFVGVGDYCGCPCEGCKAMNVHCTCADIIEQDKSRHFKECPKRGEFPEPAVARAIDAEALVEHLRADLKDMGDIAARRGASEAALESSRRFWV